MPSRDKLPLARRLAAGWVLLGAAEDAGPLAPALPWEATGQDAAGTTFIEGLVRFHDRWLLYHGCADSRVGVAISGASPLREDQAAAGGR